MKARRPTRHFYKVVYSAIWALLAQLKIWPAYYFLRLGMGHELYYGFR